MAGGNEVRFSEKFGADRIRVPLSSRTKPEVLRELVSLLGRDPQGSEAILAAVQDRESRMSTGIGRGVAIPHGKSEVVADLEVACGITAAPIDYGSLDHQPVRVLFLLVSPPVQTTAHIRALGQISRMLASDAFLDELLGMKSPGDFLALIRREETDLED
jgi:mannitol/fructose-specific phosphotransferase system IIA component (Ntr-type)